MNLKEIMKEGPLTLAVGANDLMVFAKNLIYEAKRELEEAVIKKQSERYVSTKTACNILDVDECTLWRFGKKQLLFPIKVGGKNRYRISDIERIMCVNN